MKTNPVLLTLLALALVPASLAQSFSSGSDGSDGILNATANTEIVLPPGGVLKYQSVTIAAGATVTFKRNALNTPVTLLSQGDVIINGTIDVSGYNTRLDTPDGGAPGPGGFEGGKPGFGTTPPGDGQGPGGGRGGVYNRIDPASAGAGSYGSRGTDYLNSYDGVAYGSPLLIPIVGGSGGGGMAGTPGRGGGGGGGAILVASSTRIQLGSGGHILALGGGDRSNGSEIHNPGSGGAIRLVAPTVAGNGELNVFGGHYAYAGNGRIRIDCQIRNELSLRLNPVSAASVGSTMFLVPNPQPHLDIIEACGKAIAVGEPQTVSVVLPFNSNPSQVVKVQARDFGSTVPISVVITPDNGPRTVVEAEIDNKTSNPGSVTVPVTLPLNVQVSISVWTR